MRLVLVLMLALAVSACGTDASDGGADTAVDTTGGGDSGSADATEEDTGGEDSGADTAVEDAGGTDTESVDVAADAGLPEPERHRSTAEVCDRDRDDTPVETFGMDDECETHADCTEGENGRCTNLGRWIACTYDNCFEDSDCGETACLCEGGAGASNACMGGNCQTDADCGPGGWCSPSYGDCGDYSGVVAFYCHTPEDECVNDSDCGEYPSYCWFDPSLAHWACSNSHCAG